MTHDARISERGMTLVELMVSVGLFGILSLAIANLFADQAKMQARARNETLLSESIQEFSEALDSYLSNTTRLIGCGCAANCVFGDAVVNDCAQSPCTLAPLLQFETEMADNPGMDATMGGCPGNPVASPVNPFSPDAIHFRGCKQRLRLEYTLPTDGPPRPLPGVLAIFRETAAGARVGQPLHALSGVYALFCGQTQFMGVGNFARRSADQFRLQARVKARSSNVSAGPEFESWVWNGQKANSGTHRAFSVDVNFRNLTNRGVHYGKPLSVAGCTADGGADPTGNCCSGYWQSGNCLSAANCVRPGAAPVNGNPNLGFAECCSHQLLNGVCL